MTAASEVIWLTTHGKEVSALDSDSLVTAGADVPRIGSQNETITPMTRPTLNEVPIPANPFAPGNLSITVSPGQWSALIKCFYESGHLLLEIEEVNGKERIARAYKLDARDWPIIEKGRDHE